MVEDTVCKDCPFKAQGFKECPNYIQTVWTDKNSPQPQLVTDCAPRRTLLMLQELYNRCFGMQRQIHQLENQFVECKANVKALTEIFEDLKRVMIREQMTLTPIPSEQFINPLYGKHQVTCDTNNSVQ